MAIHPFTQKQMKDGTLATLRLAGMPLDERDYRAIGNFIRGSKNLTELDLSQAYNALEQLQEAIKQNRSIRKISASQVLQDHNLPVLIDVLAANSGISVVKLDNNYFQGFGLVQFAKFLKDKDTVTHLSMNGVQTEDSVSELDDMDDMRGGFAGRMPPRRRGSGSLDRIAKTLEGSSNILQFSPSTTQTDAVCAANRAAAEALVKAALKDDVPLTAADVESVKKRMSSFLFVAENEILRDRKQVAQLLIAVEDAAEKNNIAFVIPDRYATAAAELPRPFTASEDKVDFAALAKASPADLYKAVEAGQVADMLAFLKGSGQKINAEDCLVKPEGKRENLIELAARQGKLSDLLTVDNWINDARGLKAAIAAAPRREWQRQMKGMTPERLVYLVNAASFKTGHGKTPRPQPSL
jgi:hypothetical protein